MIFRSCRTLMLAAALSGSGFVYNTAAGEETPQPPVKPNDPPKVPDTGKIPVLEVPAIPAQDWDRFLFDFQGADADKQKAAEKALIDAGNRGYVEMAKFLNSPNPDIAKRAKAIREEIDKRSWTRYTEMATYQQKVEGGPLDVPTLQNLQKAWMAMAVYASQNALRQSGFQQAAAVQKEMKTVEGAIKELGENDQKLKGLTDAQKLDRATVQMARANALKTLNRDDEAIAAVQNALDSGAAAWRGKPAALKLLSEIYSRKQDPKNALAAAQRIIQEHPKSLEVKFAYMTVVDQALLDGEWDKAIATLKTLFALCPVDEEVNDKLFGTLSSLMDDNYQYKHVAALSEWLIEVLPRERLTGDAPKLAGGTNEYVLKDYAKAAKYYKMLGDGFPEMIDPKDMEPILARVQQKAEGKFPKETVDTDPGPAGTLMKFVNAIRTRDHKTAASLVPKAESEGYAGGENDESMISALTFADIIIKKTDVDDKLGKATFDIDFYEASSLTPTEMKQKAIKEDGAWKIVWRDADAEGEDAGEGDGGGEMKPAPAVQAPADKKDAPASATAPAEKKDAPAPAPAEKKDAPK